VVATQGGETYAYFTYNAQPGGVLVYRVGDTSATELYTPVGADANYCVASLVVGADGTLYYTNDSGKLFALARIAPLDNGDGGDEDSDDDAATEPENSDNRTPEIPQTGDSTGLALVALLLLCTALALLLILKRQQNNRQIKD
jgi:LPXTG-motif cell wall-anchored protein